jgi:hypothetical protein
MFSMIADILVESKPALLSSFRIPGSLSLSDMPRAPAKHELLIHQV